MASPAVVVRAPMAGHTTPAIALELPGTEPVTTPGHVSTAAMTGRSVETMIDAAMASPAVVVHAPMAGHTTPAIALELPGTEPVTTPGHVSTAAMNGRSVETMIDAAMAVPAVVVHAPMAGSTTLAIFAAPEPHGAVTVPLHGDASTA